MGTVADVMVREPLVTIGPGENVAEAAAVVREHGVSHLLVTDADALLGIVCICDLDAASALQPMRELMTRRPIAVESNLAVEDAVALMRREHLSLLPVMRDGRLVGVLGHHELRALGMDLDGGGTHATCAACGSTRHVRSHAHMQVVGFCLECDRSSQPPDWGDDLGGQG